ncbi:HlyC/CorC family transporter [Rhodocytophaga rosea]|uniref:HlyC/CorC family transporter n=1 Tax=Rhodocytophaga rosea TaxID=2704465 RepID=A0A6C0GWW2_9BACT|nr:HlyC/CorC family transporter [Rhodocytophaga rosea]
MHVIISIIGTLLLVLLNGFFVAAEFAIVKVRPSQIELMAKTGSGAAIMAKKIVAKLDAYLSATQLGITLASLGLGWVGESLVEGLILDLFAFFGLAVDTVLIHRISIGVAFSIITVLHIVFGELAPKSIAIQRSEGVTLGIAYPLNVFYVVFRPFIWLLNGFANLILKAIGIAPASEHEVHSPEELRFLVEQGNESGNMETTEYEIIRNAFDFSERTARQVMVPRTKVVGLNIEQADDKMLDKVIDEGYSRVPVFKNSLDNIIGVIHIKDLLLRMRKKENIVIKDLLRPAHFVPESKRVSDLLRDFQRQRLHMAIVVNEYGGTEGIISMEDIVEEIVGEIQDEYDNESPIVEEVTEGKYKVLGSASIADINEYLPVAIEENKEYDSLAGLLIYHFGRIPEDNEHIVIAPYEFTILKRSRNNIVQVEINTLPEEPLASPKAST